jgi:hypothetical protein
VPGAIGTGNISFVWIFGFLLLHEGLLVDFLSLLFAGAVALLVLLLGFCLLQLVSYLQAQVGVLSRPIENYLDVEN